MLSTLPVLGGVAATDEPSIMTFSAALFRSHVGTAFAVRLPGNRDVALQLESVANDAAEEGEGGDHTFSLFFTDAIDTSDAIDGSAAPLPQGAYALRHAQLGEQFIFLVPVAHNAAGGYRYQACFNVQA
jgi:hypothetical protein